MSEQTWDRETDYAERRARFAGLSSHELVGIFNQDVGNPGWTSARANHCAALILTLEEREIDLDAIRSEQGGISWAQPIRLNEQGAVEVSTL